MTRDKILKVAEQKKNLAREMLREGKTGTEITNAVTKKFKSGIGHNVMVQLRQELTEQSSSEVVMMHPVAEPQGELETRLDSIFGWMGEEGINRIRLDLESREVRLERTEVIRC